MFDALGADQSGSWLTAAGPPPTPARAITNRGADQHRSPGPGHPIGQRLTCRRPRGSTRRNLFHLGRTPEASEDKDAHERPARWRDNIVEISRHQVISARLLADKEAVTTAADIAQAAICDSKD